MYVPTRFEVNDYEQVVDFIQQNSFAAVVSYDGEKPIATHIPLTLKSSENKQLVLEGHVARANSQWKTLAEEKEVLIIFTGAHSYISPRWYEEPLENVPTWNYQAVHVYGKVRFITDDNELFTMFKRLVEKYENNSSYQLENVNADYVAKLTKAIVGFEITATRIEAAFKLSQHKRETASFANTIVELEKLGDENSLAIAAAMRENLPERKI